MLYSASEVLFTGPELHGVEHTLAVIISQGLLQHVHCMGGLV